ncbi:MAG TPA: hypothetical protein VG838_08470 [Opitutaceae bacterium]|nr:hypothetical protein [Opitutaceae bacterium]
MAAPDAFHQSNRQLRAGQSDLLKSVVIVVVCATISSAATWFVMTSSAAPAAPKKDTTAVALAASVPVDPPSARSEGTARATTITAEQADTRVYYPATRAAEPVAPGPPPNGPVAPDAAPFDLTAFVSGQGPASPREVAKAALTLSQTIGEDESFVAPTAHSALYRDLKTMETMSNAVLQDNGSDPTMTANLTSALSAVLDETISRTDIIANRQGETPDAVQKTIQLQALVKAIKGRQQGP